MGGAGRSGSERTQDGDIKSVIAYDVLGRPTTTRLTLPSDDPLVTSGAITATSDQTKTYRLDGTPNTTASPAAGGLPAETLQLSYTALGLPTGLSGTTDYVQNASYSPIGDIEQLTLARSAAAGARKTFIGNTYEDGTRRLLKSTVNDQTHNGMLQELTYKYDQAGNVLSIFDSAPLSGFTKADNQGFSYDTQRRLTEAWTPKTADCATSGRTAANLDGAAPHWNSYTYTASGQRATEKTNTGTPQTRTYCYDPASPAHPGVHHHRRHVRRSHHAVRLRRNRQHDQAGGDPGQFYLPDPDLECGGQGRQAHGRRHRDGLRLRR